MKTTPIYGLPYIEAGDLVSSAPAQFKTMAEGFENALNEVDSRNTPAGVKPAIATTLETLAGITGVTGQAGYVTADPAEGNNGPYCCAHRDDLRRVRHTRRRFLNCHAY